MPESSISLPRRGVLGLDMRMKEGKSEMLGGHRHERASLCSERGDLCKISQSHSSFLFVPFIHIPCVDPKTISHAFGSNQLQVVIGQG